MKHGVPPRTMSRLRSSMWLCLLMPMVLATAESAGQEPERAAPAWMPFQPADFQIGDDAEAGRDPHRQLTPEEAERAVEKAQRSARVQHKLMSQFMRNFARNMKYAILEDSAGDMPEEQRRAALQHLQLEQARTPPVDLFGAGPAEQQAPPAELAVGPSEAEPAALPSMLNARSMRHRRPPRHAHHAHMQDGPPMVFSKREDAPSDCPPWEPTCGGAANAPRAGPALLPLRGGAKVSAVPPTACLFALALAAHAML
mmetsp:Transcript_60666/g.112539  ORF Transcript_60666/g.112539 Transcript_60666/m.112539 type:complete len:256 (+) Transcript_60666:90-857(+)